MADDEDFQLRIKHGYWILPVDLCHNVAHLHIFIGTGVDCGDSLVFSVSDIFNFDIIEDHVAWNIDLP